MGLAAGAASPTAVHGAAASRYVSPRESSSSSAAAVHAAVSSPPQPAGLHIQTGSSGLSGLSGGTSGGRDVLSPPMTTTTVTLTLTTAGTGGGGAMAAHQPVALAAAAAAAAAQLQSVAAAAPSAPNPNALLSSAGGQRPPIPRRAPSTVAIAVPGGSPPFGGAASGRAPPALPLDSDTAFSPAQSPTSHGAGSAGAGVAPSGGAAQQPLQQQQAPRSPPAFVDD